MIYLFPWSLTALALPPPPSRSINTHRSHTPIPWTSSDRKSRNPLQRRSSSGSITRTSPLFSRPKHRLLSTNTYLPQRHCPVRNNRNLPRCVRGDSRKPLTRYQNYGSSFPVHLQTHFPRLSSQCRKGNIYPRRVTSERDRKPFGRYRYSPHSIFPSRSHSKTRHENRRLWNNHPNSWNGSSGRYGAASWC